MILGPSRTGLLSRLGRLSRIGASGILLATTLLAAGCSAGSESAGPVPEPGFVDQPAAQIVDAAVSAMRGLEYAHIAGSLASAGSAVSSVDMSVSTNGECRGSMGVGNGTMEVIANPTGTWFKGDEPLWGSMAGANAPAAMAAAGDRWAILPEASGGLAGLCDLAVLVDGLGGGQGQTYSAGATTEIDGVPVIAVTNDDQGSTAYVATSTPHYFVQIVGGGDQASTSVRFSAYNEPFAVETPSDPFDLEAFTGSTS